MRRKLVDTRMSLVALARGLTKGLGERLPACKPDAFVRKVRQARSLVAFPGLDTLLEVIEVLDAKIHGRLRLKRYWPPPRLRQLGGPTIG